MRKLLAVTLVVVGLFFGKMVINAINETDLDIIETQDFDNAGIPDFVRTDFDNAGIPDFVRTDFDNAGIPDFVRTDFDNAGIPDFVRT